MRSSHGEITANMDTSFFKLEEKLNTRVDNLGIADTHSNHSSGGRLSLEER